MKLLGILAFIVLTLEVISAHESHDVEESEGKINVICLVKVVINLIKCLKGKSNENWYHSAETLDETINYDDSLEEGERKPAGECWKNAALEALSCLVSGQEGSKEDVEGGNIPVLEENLESFFGLEHILDLFFDEKNTKKPSGKRIQ